MRPALAATAIALLASTFFAGCGRFFDYAKVVDGNRLHERGDYQGAIAAYLGAGRGSAESFAATIDYDVANVYARLGEYPAATELYSAARHEGSKAIAADSYFNDGVALYEQGRFEDAWKAFRSALALLDPTSRSAEDGRHNLELAWRAWKKSSMSPTRTFAPSSRGFPDRDESEQRLLQRLETGHWRPGTSQGAIPSSSDY
jgi:tetratricopeptide (TPR) repeat protein